MPACPTCGVDNPDRARFCLDCGQPLGTAPAEREQPRESRRTVTVLFSDLVGSTALGEQLDPETLRAVMGRYFATMQAVLKRHGGTVEKFIGDAIMAVFGLSELHEDDALRAVRAASEMREALAVLNQELSADVGVTIAVRTGVHTGEVVAGDPAAGQTLVTGDAVNTAARLEQAAPTGEILLGRQTWLLVRDAVMAEPVEPIAAKGKTEPLVAMRLVALHQPADGTQIRSIPLVGRDVELARMLAAWEQAQRHAQPSLISVVGAAGVGKSRLVAAFVDRVGENTTVLRGSCLPYGEGITFLPITQVVHAAAGIVETDSRMDGQAKLATLLADAKDGPLLARRLASAIGLSDEPSDRDEIFWAVRRTLEHLAMSRPLVVLVEDIHWAEPTLLELLEHILAFARDVPLLLVCPTRPDLLERSPGWPGEGRTGTAIVLDGLPGDAASALIDALPGGSAVPPGLRTRILAAAEGNPLFVEEMVRMLAEDGQTSSDDGTAGGPTFQVPATIQALLAARIDRLPGKERRTAQRASVVGRAFEADTVVALTPDDTQEVIRDSLLGLLRREVITPDQVELSVGDAYRFRHVLIRDAAYEAMAKAERAELHVRFADWLERTAGDRLGEYQDILGYHLGQAYRYRSELRDLGPETSRTGARAAAHLAHAGRRARDLGDLKAAVGLFERAATLPKAEPRVHAQMLLDWGMAMAEAGDVAGAGSRAAAAMEAAVELGDRGLMARARLLRLDIHMVDGTYEGSDQRIIAEQDLALADAEAAGDEIAMADALSSKSFTAWNSGQVALQDVLSRRALDHARRAGDRRMELEIECHLLVTDFAGQTPVPMVVKAGLELLADAADHPSVAAEPQALLAVSEAWLGDFEQARVHADAAVATLEDLAQVIHAAHVRTYRAWVERIAGDPVAAEAILRTALDEARNAGEAAQESFVACRIAEALVAQGRHDDAAAMLAIAERYPVAATSSRILGAWARIHADRGERETAVLEVERLVAGANDIWPNVACDAYVDAAEATLAMGDARTAAGYAREAMRCAAMKGIVARDPQLKDLLARCEAP